MIRFLMIQTIMMVLIMAPSFSNAQNIVWERTITPLDSNEQGGQLNDLVYTEHNTIIAVGAASKEVFYGPVGYKGQPRILKLDSLGQVIWVKGQVADTLSEGYNTFIKKIPNESGGFYVGSMAKQATIAPGGRYEDIVIKIDTAADTIWTARFTYFTAFRNTLLAATVLKDKSIVTVGYNLEPGTGSDILYRRIDSLGNLMWEEVYSLAGDQFGFDITEMMDGSMMIAGSSDDDNLLIRIGFDGRLIHSNVISFNDKLNLTFCNLNRDNSLLNTSVYQINSGDYQNLNIVKNLIFQTMDTLGIGATKSIIDVDSNAVILYSDGSHSRVVNINLNSKTRNWDLDLMPQGIPLISPSSIVFSTNSSFIIAGFNRDSLNNRNYWLSKISGVGEEWIPDRCAFSPPVAGFAYDLNGGILTLQDTSYAGLKYLDTIYTWQWTFGNGMVDTTESPITLWDTVSSPTLDVELIVSNWYGCTDTLQTTLIANPVGTGIIAMNQFTEKVWPNPARDILHISLSEKPGQIVKFEIFDVHGRVQKTMRFEGTEATLNISSLPQGIYFYKLNAGGVVKRGKVVKG